MAKNIWTREQTIIALNLYCKMPFGHISGSNPIIIEHAKLLGRTPSSLGQKMCNIARFDPALQARGIKGLTHGAKLEEIIWNEFINDPERLSYESEKLLAELRNEKIEDTVNIDIDNLPAGSEKESIVRQRVGQDFFRTVVVTSYDYTCCITGLRNEHLVEACHISDWADDVKNRTNPSNGLCMNPLFHTAYDRNLISVSPDYIINISDEMIENATTNDFKDYLMGVNNRKIIMPDRFLPSKELLAKHYELYKSSK